MHHSRTADAPTDEQDPRTRASRGPVSVVRRALPLSTPVSRRARFVVVVGARTAVHTAALYVPHRLPWVPLVEASAVAVEPAVVHTHVLNDHSAVPSRIDGEKTRHVGSHRARGEGADVRGSVLQDRCIAPWSRCPR
ncbi:GtrA domain-containing protein [Streptomyces dysideae]|uniref:Uncharacterized protein n=1 Tax=Streptomyces dysideae TaxID=909626 RepID=A0A117RXK7_9ACTN|nr:hypothetical protein [Streptomyces dysideae]KUO14524.1 hypothetical protein AQJ91_46340 [Streptomyces dysideae]